MSETNVIRNGPVLAAAEEFEANQTVATRDALLAAIRAAKASRFYVVGERLFLWTAGGEREIAECRGPVVAEALRDRLNADLVAGWVPSVA